MARKGSLKVKTGCLTCKVRKVKCDEVKPFCLRCTKTGRRCDGYSAARSQEALPLVWVPSPSPDPKPLVSDAECRSLDFFHRAVAPALSGPIDSKFWTHVVMQVSQKEPAVRHAAVAISSLYEHFNQEAAAASGNEFAIRHYNQAISQLMSNPDETVVLFVCVLLTCAEFLQGNVQSAIEHCRHGVTILNSTSITRRTREQLMPLFCRLSIFPYFFGGSPATFPKLDGIDLPTHIPTSFKSTDELQGSLDVLLCRAIRFVREGDPYRLRINTTVPESTLADQARMQADIRLWGAGFSSFKQSRVLHDAETMLCLVLQMRHLIAAIWVSTALEYDEAVYDAHVDQFKTIVNLASLALSSALSAPRPKFIFEMGFLPPLYFVVVKCRCLQTRLAALRLMKALSTRRENLWDLDVMYAVGAKVIEMEHKVSMAELSEEGWVDADVWVDSDRGRVMDMMIDQYVPENREGTSGRTPSKHVTFFFPSEDGDVKLHRERVLLRN